MARANDNPTLNPTDIARARELRAAAANVGSPTKDTANLILRSLPVVERTRVLAASTVIPLQQHQILYEPGQPVDQVYFLDSGMVSVLTVGDGGRVIETGIIGREGLVGSAAVLGSEKAVAQAAVHISGTAHRVSVSRFLDVLEESPVLAGLVHRHTYFLLFQAQ